MLCATQGRIGCAGAAAFSLGNRFTPFQSPSKIRTFWPYCYARIRTFSFYCYDMPPQKLASGACTDFLHASNLRFCALQVRGSRKKGYPYIKTLLKNSRGLLLGFQAAPAVVEPVDAVQGQRDDRAAAGVGDQISLAIDLYVSLSPFSVSFHPYPCTSSPGEYVHFLWWVKRRLRVD